MVKVLATLGLAALTLLPAESFATEDSFAMKYYDCFPVDLPEVPVTIRIGMEKVLRVGKSSTSYMGGVPVYLVHEGDNVAGIRVGDTSFTINDLEQMVLFESNEAQISQSIPISLTNFHLPISSLSTCEGWEGNTLSGGTCFNLGFLEEVSLGHDVLGGILKYMIGRSWLAAEGSTSLRDRMEKEWGDRWLSYDLIVTQSVGAPKVYLEDEYGHRRVNLVLGMIDVDDSNLYAGVKEVKGFYVNNFAEELSILSELGCLMPIRQP